MKIGVCSLTIGEEYRNYTKYGRLNKIEYCKKHGYDFIEDESVYDKTKPIPWSKLLLIEKYLPLYDYVVWMDSDMYIMNMDIRLESFIEKMAYSTNPTCGERDIMCGSDWKMLNTGTLFVKNSEFSKKFLRSVFEHTEYEVTGNWEQDAFIDLFHKNFMNCKEKILVAKPQDFNSYWFNYYDGQFILHFAGTRGWGLRCIMYRMCPMRMDEDNDDSFNWRMNWLRTNEFRKEFDAAISASK